MLSEGDFKHKYLQHPITFLTEENLEKLETHCIRASRTEIGVEHKVVLELLDRYYQYKKENEELKATINKQSIDISKNLLELQQKDKQIDLMAEVMFKNNTAQLIIEYGIENKEQIIKEFEKLVKEKG